MARRQEAAASSVRNHVMVAEGEGRMKGRAWVPIVVLYGALLLVASNRCMGQSGLEGTPASRVTDADMGKEVFVHGTLTRIRHMTDHTFWDDLWALQGGVVLSVPQAKQSVLKKGRRVDVRGRLHWVPGRRGKEGGWSSGYFAIQVKDITPSKHLSRTATRFDLKPRNNRGPIQEGPRPEPSTLKP